MKTPPGLAVLLDEGVISGVVTRLKSGKEADVYVVDSPEHGLCCAKVYKDQTARSFKTRVQYQEGRSVRGSRDQRAMGKGSSFGRAEAEAQWKTTEVEALYRLYGGGVRVPKPLGFYEGVLLMERILGPTGHTAPRLSEMPLTPDVARVYHYFLMGEVCRMLCQGLIHGDLSAFNILVDPIGPVIIDLPQVVNASGNPQAQHLLRRDIVNVTRYLAEFAPDLNRTRYAEEMWSLFQKGELTPESELTGRFEAPRRRADLRGVFDAIDDAYDERDRREAGRRAAAAQED